MQGINKAIIVGRLGQDPEVKYPSPHITVANCSIATSEQYKDKTSGETKTVTEWHKVVFFNKLAEIVRDFLKKGAAVYIEGKLKTEKYTDKDGVERYVTKIIANNLQMLGNKSEGTNDKSGKDTPTNLTEGFDDDIPF